MLSDLAHGIGMTAWQFWQVLTVPPSKRSSTRFYRNQYWEADEEHQALIPPDTLRRDWQGNVDDPTPRDP